MSASSDKHSSKAQPRSIKGYPWLTDMTHNQHSSIQLMLRDLEPPERLLQHIVNFDLTRLLHGNVMWHC